MQNEIFPQGLALGDNFCNRIIEQEHPAQNILTSRPTLIMSPRRYGKTSLVTNVIDKLKIPFADIDLYSELDEFEIQNSILKGIGKLVYLVETTKNKAIHFVSEFFSELNVSFRYQGAEIVLDLNKFKKPPAKTLLAALKKLDELLIKRKKKVVFFSMSFNELPKFQYLERSKEPFVTLHNSLKRFLLYFPAVTGES